jgi:hypothetical protein
MVGVSTGAGLELRDAGPGAVRVGGSLEVTSPIPHADDRAGGPVHVPAVQGRFSDVRSGAHGSVPQRVDLSLERDGAGRPEKLVYTIAVVL